MTTIQVKKLMRYGLFFMSFVIIVGLAFASKGGDKNKKRTANMKSDFVPIRIVSPFTLKSGFAYSGSRVFNVQKENNSFSINSLITYQRGNTTFIVPYQYRINSSVVNIAPVKSNLQMLDVKISMHK
ncbi:MAG TPA: hypothetical protein VKR32_10110 [Puia sp.]|nr:hypothetical protein [Puia sp.]